MSKITDPAPLGNRRLSDQVAENLRGRIFRGELEPGERLREVDICAQLGISRAPFREGLLLLAREGLVRVQPHHGAAVVEVSPDELREIGELRIVLESMAARLTASRRDPDTFRALHDCLHKLERAADAFDPADAALAHIEFHRIIGRGSGFARLAHFIDNLTAQSFALRTWAVLSQTELLERIAPHRELLETIETGDADLAEFAMKSHIREHLLAVET